VNARDEAGYVPLHFAQKYSLVTALIAAGADVNAASTRTKITVLHLAANQGNFLIVAQLLKNKAQVDLLDIWGHTPLYQAIIRGSIQTVRLLVQAGASITPELIQLAYDQVEPWRIRKYDERHKEIKNTQERILGAQEIAQFLQENMLPGLEKIEEHISAEADAVISL